MREKIMKKGHLLLTLLAFVCLMGLGTIHANAATVKAKVDVKKFYGIAEQVLDRINKKRQSEGLNALKLDENLTEAAMNIALQEQGGDASASNPDIYNNTYIDKSSYRIMDRDILYEDNLWNETTTGKKKVLDHVADLGEWLYEDNNTSTKIGIGIVATNLCKNIPRELDNGAYYNTSYCFVSNNITHDNTDYVAHSNSGKTVRTQMVLYINPSSRFLCICSNEDKLSPKYTYDIVKKGKIRTLNPGVWENIINGVSKRLSIKLSNSDTSWSSSDTSVVTIDRNGNLKAKNYGIATVTVKIGSLQATKKYVVSDTIGMDTDTLLYLPNWKSKSSIPKNYTGNCYAEGCALEVKNGRITWSKNMKTNKITRPGSKKSTVMTKKIKGNYYKIISKSKKTVQYVKPQSKNITSINIPSVVKISGKRYKVTGIAANAFKNCKKLKKATIGTNVNNIGKRAFYGCSKLKIIKIKTSKLTNNRVGKQAFRGIHKKVVIKVPKKQLKAYKRWFRIKGIGKKATIKK